jgi:hypothetical protein
MNRLIFILFLSGLFLQIQIAGAQSRRQKMKSDFLAFDIDHDEMTPRMYKAPSYLIVKDTKGKLIGNKCVDLYTQKLGFNYLVLNSSNCYNKTGFSIMMHNFWVQCKVTLRHGPFWKATLKNKIRECRKLSGDYVG